MKIIYTICGDGNGHAFRSSVVIDHLLSQGHELKIISSNKGGQYLASRYPGVLLVAGMSLMYDYNRVKKSRTIAKNLAKVKFLPHDVKAVRAMMKDFKPEVVITDFEPLAAFIASGYDIPLISIDNQHMITDTAIKIAAKDYPDYLLARIYAESILPSRDYSLITTFFYPRLKKRRLKDTWLTPPLIRPEIIAVKPWSGDYIVVYQTSDSYTQLVDILQKSKEKFIIYNGSHELGVGPNMVFRDFSPSQMVQDLAGAKGVIINGGFTVMTESLYLGKPVLSVPIKMQYEQILNARQIEALGLGLATFELTTDLLETWVARLPIYKKAIEKIVFDNNYLLSKLNDILKGISTK